MSVGRGGMPFGEGVNPFARPPLARAVAARVLALASDSQGRGQTPLRSPRTDSALCRWIAQRTVRDGARHFVNPVGGGGGDAVSWTYLAMLAADIGAAALLIACPILGFGAALTFYMHVRRIEIDPAKDHNLNSKTSEVGRPHRHACRLYPFVVLPFLKGDCHHR